MEQSNITGPMERAEAQALTDRIRNAVENISQLVSEARDRRAWKALGYKTWEEYVKAEFGMGRSYSYRVADHGHFLAVIAEAAGELSPMGDIPERATREIKENLPAVAAEIKERVAAGEEPAKAVKETVDAARDAKAKEKAEKKEKQAEHDRQRDEARAALPQAIKDREAAKQKAITEQKAKPPAADALQAELEELREANVSLTAEVEDLKAELKKFDEMRVQYERGGFEKVIADKDEEIRVLQTRLYTESGDKAKWMNLSKYWQAEAMKLGFSRDAIIDIETGEVVDG